MEASLTRLPGATDAAHTAYARRLQILAALRAEGAITDERYGYQIDRALTAYLTAAGLSPAEPEAT